MAAIIGKVASKAFGEILNFVKKPRTADKMFDVAEHFFAKGTATGLKKGKDILGKAIELFPDNPKLLSKYSSLSDEVAALVAKTQSDIGQISYPGLKLSKGGIALTRNPKFICDIPYNKDNYYRAIGKGGYEDFLTSGIIRAKQGTKYDYTKIYFEKGHVNSIYTRKGGSEFIVESNSPRILVTNEGAYPSVESLNPQTDSFRIWRRLAEDKNGIPSYEIVYDTMSKT